MGLKLNYPRRIFFEILIFIIAIREFQRINEKECLNFLESNFDIDKLIEYFKNIEVGDEKYESLLKELLGWLSSQGLLKDACSPPQTTP